ncbi:hypothetical protein Hanom_Chr11g01012561 [Helianthus anomalus]
MEYCVDHPEEISKLSKVKAHVSEVKGVMMENIEKVILSKVPHTDCSNGLEPGFISNNMISLIFQIEFKKD